MLMGETQVACLLTLVNFMMQDTVLTMCKESVKEFVSFIL